MRTEGPKLKRATSARVVACPVFSYAQMLRANWLMYVPKRLKNCPDQTTENRRIPESLILPPPMP
jgi:hypothetical protein